jgi:cytosine/adenosine deaminase-related metal-dependent hydrolase
MRPAQFGTTTGFSSKGHGRDPTEETRSALMSEQALLLKGGRVISMDPSIGELPSGDVLIRGTKVAEVAVGIDAADAEVVDSANMIVIPGLVDTHRHTWQTAIKGMSSDWSLPEYLAGIRGRIGPQFSPNDVYAATLLGATEALNGGVTTLVDWAHIMNSPAHADGSVAALKEYGGRAIFAHGTPNDERIAEWYIDSTIPHSDDIRRVREEEFPSDDGLVTLMMAARGPQHTTPETSAGDWRLARELGIRITVHAGEGAWSLRHQPVLRLHEQGVLGPDTTFVHGNQFSDEDFRLIAESGGSISISPEVEMHMGLGYPITGRSLRHGIISSLSVDVPVTVGGDMFSVMRCALSAERALVNEESIRRVEMVEHLTISSEDILRMATIDGAKASGLDGRTGSITPGKDADIVLMRSNDLNLAPVNQPIAAVVVMSHPGNVDSVLVAGRFVKRNGVMLSIDVDSVLAKAIESRDSLLERAGVGPDYRPDDIEAWSKL